MLDLILYGYDNATIAKSLFISDNTVKSHIKSIFMKMDVHTRFELVAKINPMDEE